MSTDIHELVEPWTSVRAKAAGKHTYIEYWANRASAGHLILDNDEALTVLRSICGDCIARISAKAGSAVLTVYREPRTDCVIDDHGRVLSHRVLREVYRSVQFLSDEWKELNPDWNISPRAVRFSAMGTWDS